MSVWQEFIAMGRNALIVTIGIIVLVVVFITWPEAINKILDLNLSAVKWVTGILGAPWAEAAARALGFERVLIAFEFSVAVKMFFILVKITSYR